MPVPADKNETISSLPTSKPIMRKSSNTSEAPLLSSKKPMEHSDSVGSTHQTKKKVEALFTSLKDAKMFYDERKALFIDARPIEDYEAEHVEGAISLDQEKLDELFVRALGKVSKEQLIVTYCSDPECSEAIKLADNLVARGYEKVVILLEGLPGWSDAGYPIISEKEPE
jgi:rhodanese-related sulfurtransferase